MKQIEFMRSVEKQVRETIKKYDLCDKKQRIAVAVSGGKDSTVCLYILHKLGYNVEGITIDAVIGNYTKQNLENLKSVCEKYNIKLNIVSFREEFGMSLCYMKSVLQSKGYDYSSCKICGILKRYLLNKYAKKLGFDRLATGHNMDDEAQAVMMNLFRADLNMFERQGAVTGKPNKSFVQRIKPLYEVLERDVEKYSKLMKFPVNYGRCPCSVDAYRRKYRAMLDALEKKNKDVKKNILAAHERIKKKLSRKRKNREGKNVVIKNCKLCGEPSSNDVCRTCGLFRELGVEL
jgi:uncharacterized protein (TIGR00269 family)